METANLLAQWNAMKVSERATPIYDGTVYLKLLLNRQQMLLQFIQNGVQKIDGEDDPVIEQYMLLYARITTFRPDLRPFIT